MKNTTKNSALPPAPPFWTGEGPALEKMLVGWGIVPTPETLTRAWWAWSLINRHFWSIQRMREWVETGRLPDPSVLHPRRVVLVCPATSWVNWDAARFDWRFCASMSSAEVDFFYSWRLTGLAVSDAMREKFVNWARRHFRGVKWQYLLREHSPGGFVVDSPAVVISPVRRYESDEPESGWMFHVEIFDFKGKLCNPNP